MFLVFSYPRKEATTFLKTELTVKQNKNLLV